MSLKSLKLLKITKNCLRLPLRAGIYCPGIRIRHSLGGTCTVSAFPSSCRASPTSWLCVNQPGRVK
jgi:hypothetical protein